MFEYNVPFFCSMTFDTDVYSRLNILVRRNAVAEMFTVQLRRQRVDRQAACSIINFDSKLRFTIVGLLDFVTADT